MDSEKAIYILRILHTSINDRLFFNIFGANYPNMLSIWYTNEQNAIDFIRLIDRDSKIKFWNWVKTLGINKIEHLQQAYSIISVIYDSFDELDTEEDTEIYEITKKYPLDNMVRFIVDIKEEEVKTLIEWCKTWLIDLELEKGKIAPICFYEKKDIVLENKIQDISIDQKPIKTRSRMNPFQGQSNDKPNNIQIKKFSTTPRYVSLKYRLTHPGKPNILQ